MSNHCSIISSKEAKKEEKKLTFAYQSYQRKHFLIDPHPTCFLLGFTTTHWPGIKLYGAAFFQVQSQKTVKCSQRLRRGGEEIGVPSYLSKSWNQGAFTALASFFQGSGWSGLSSQFSYQVLCIRQLWTGHARLSTIQTVICQLSTDKIDLKTLRLQPKVLLNPTKVVSQISDSRRRGLYSHKIDNRWSPFWTSRTSPPSSSPHITSPKSSLASFLLISSPRKPPRHELAR